MPDARALLAEDFARVLAGFAEEDFAAVERVAVRGRLAVVVAAGFARLLSSAVTRARRLSTSLRRSSRTFRSASDSRTRWAAWANSSTRSRPRFCAPALPSLVAFSVRSTALRTASTGSEVLESCLSFFFLSFLAMGRV